MRAVAARERRPGPRAVTPAPVRVLAAGDEVPDAAGALVVLAPPGGTALPAALAAARARGGDVSVHPSRLAGLGARYLVGVARHAAGDGWSAPELLALLAAVEERVAVWACGADLRRLRPAGARPGLPLPRRPAAARFTGGRWSAASAGAEAVADHVRDGLARGATPVAAASGRRPPRPVAAALEAAGVPPRPVRHGLADALGCRWAVEVLAAPPLSSAALGRLRERIAAAPRCSWCATPVLADRCRRCSPEGAA